MWWRNLTFNYFAEQAPHQHLFLGSPLILNEIGVSWILIVRVLH